MRSTGWLIYRQADVIQNQSYIDWFIDEANKQGLSLRLVYREALTTGITEGRRIIHYQSNTVQPPDFAVSRTVDYILRVHLEKLGVRVFNSSSIDAICNDKTLTHQHVQDIEIPVADTMFLKQGSMPDNPPLSYPFVLKEADSHGGKSVFLIQDRTDWLEHRTTLSGHVLIQTCDVMLGQDVRVFVVGKNIVGAVLRQNHHDFRSNFKLGGTAAWYELNQEETNMIHRIIEHFDFDMVGIDFLIDTEGNLLFNEIEDVVGSRTLSAVSDINILNVYCRHIQQKLSF